MAQRRARVRQWISAATTALTVSDDKNFGVLSAGVAFYGVFAIFPGLAAFIALFGLVADPTLVETQMHALGDVIPPDAMRLFEGQLRRLLATSGDALGWTTVISLLVALWSSRAGISALILGINAISRGAQRKAVRHTMTTVLLTLGMIGVTFVALLVVVVAPVAIALLPVSAATSWILEGIRWLVALCVVLTALSLLYRYGPNQDRALMPWFTPGALVVSVLWFVVSTGFSYYLSNFASYNQVYGSIGAVIALLMWFYISAYLVLMGAALNAVLQIRG
jgi:membrane protein